MRIILILLLTLTAVMPAAVALAGRADGYEAPEIEAKPPWVAILYVFIALAGICVVGFKNAKRTHLD